MPNGLGPDEYRPIYPNSPFIHIADLVNPNSGKTYREENAEKTHKIGIGALVEIKETGARMFVARLGRDCDKTPLYWLSAGAPEELSEFDMGRLYGGWDEDSLTVISQHSDAKP